MLGSETLDVEVEGFSCSGRSRQTSEGQSIISHYKMLQLKRTENGR